MRPGAVPSCAVSISEAVVSAVSESAFSDFTQGSPLGAQLQGGLVCEGATEVPRGCSRARAWCGSGAMSVASGPAQWGLV